MERECNKCVHRKEHGCEKWDCKFEPYAPTREEAIRIIREAFDVMEEEYDSADDWKEEHEARDMAIKALEQEPCEDAVSRKAVLEYIERSDAELGHSSENELVCQDIKEFPSVTPTPKWIPCSEGLPKKGQQVLVTQIVRDETIVYGTVFPFEKTREKYITAWMPKPKPYQPEMESEE